MWCREWGMWHVHEGVTHSVGSALACMHACAREHVPFDYVQMCHSACLWAVTTLMGVTVIFDCRPSRWAPALTGGEKCRKSHPWIGGGGGGRRAIYTKLTICLDKTHCTHFQFEFQRWLVGESNFQLLRRMIKNATVCIPAVMIIHTTDKVHLPPICVFVQSDCRAAGECFYCRCE